MKCRFPFPRNLLQLGLDPDQRPVFLHALKLIAIGRGLVLLSGVSEASDAGDLVRRVKRIETFQSKDFVRIVVAEDGGIGAIGEQRLATALDDDAQNGAFNQISESLLAFANGLFSAFSFGDIERNRHDAVDLSFVVAQRRLGRQKDSRLVFAIGQVFLHSEHHAVGIADLAIEPPVPCRVLRAEQFASAAAGGGMTIDVEELLVVGVQKDDPTVRIASPNQRGYGVDDPPEFFFLESHFLGVPAERRLELAFQKNGAASDRLLLMPNGQKMAGADAELTAVHRAQQEVTGPRVERPISIFPILVCGDDDDRDIGRARLLAASPDELVPEHRRHDEIRDDKVGGLVGDAF